jgi:phage shock protein PspC (stress-responsive transcriptional regulator)
MTRSFTDRVFGGVCGGLGNQLRVNPWLIRLAIAAFTLASLGAGILLYLALWWLLPQESLVGRARGGAFTTFLALLLIVGFAGLWAAHLTGELAGPDGQNIFYPAAVLATGAVFLLRQLRSAG